MLFISEGAIGTGDRRRRVRMRWRMAEGRRLRIDSLRMSSYGRKTGNLLMETCPPMDLSFELVALPCPDMEQC